MNKTFLSCFSGQTSRRISFRDVEMCAHAAASRLGSLEGGHARLVVVHGQQRVTDLLLDFVAQLLHARCFSQVNAFFGVVGRRCSATFDGVSHRFTTLLRREVGCAECEQVVFWNDAAGSEIRHTFKFIHWFAPNSF